MDTQDLQRLMARARATKGASTERVMRESMLDDVLGAELLAEQAVSLGRAGRRLMERCTAARELAEQLRDSVDGPEREALLQRYADAYRAVRQARWELVVQREAMGLRNAARELDELYPMPEPPRRFQRRTH
ncbi:MAG: hypothetical protein KTR31_06300 [Myxococcales bacterium]|nr:hypothetical protein [Myxococcales bacterium]